MRRSVPHQVGVLVRGFVPVHGDSVPMRDPPLPSPPTALPVTSSVLSREEHAQAISEPRATNSIEKGSLLGVGQMGR